MGKSNYLKYFQKNLRDYIENLICKQWGYNELKISEEDGVMPGIFNGYMDISIYNPSKENSVIGIEIEHISDYSQARRNISKLKEWTHNSSKRSAGLLHIFNEACNIKPDNIGELIKFAKDSEHKNRGFYYDFIFYSVENRAKTKQNPEVIVNSMDFKARLWMLIENCGLLE
jgi:hypothetical protein